MRNKVNCVKYYGTEGVYYIFLYDCQNTLSNFGCTNNIPHESIVSMTNLSILF